MIPDGAPRPEKAASIPSVRRSRPFVASLRTIRAIPAPRSGACRSVRPGPPAFSAAVPGPQKAAIEAVPSGKIAPTSRRPNRISGSGNRKNDCPEPKTAGREPKPRPSDRSGRSSDASARIKTPRPILRPRGFQSIGDSFYCACWRVSSSVFEPTTKSS